VNPETERLALAEFAELQRLVELRDSGHWLFLPTLDEGETVDVRGVRVWPDGSADAIRVCFTTDAAGVRTDREGGVVWRREGGLVEVVDGLITLPPPGTPGAPRLVKGASGGLWTP
jgi:hypothetical protein